jgi:galactonate dehydratase
MRGATLDRLALEHVRVTPATVWSFLRVSAGGIDGVGECSLMRDTASLDAAFAHARAALAGRTIAEARAWTTANDDRPLAAAAIASAIDQALDDRDGHARGRPAALAHGSLLRDTIPLYANINRRTTDRTVDGFFASAAAIAARGWRKFKIAPFDGVTPENSASPDGRALIDVAIARVAAVRDAIGPDGELYVDCHWRFTPSAARRAIDALAPLRVTWFECPLPETPDHVDDLRALRGHANAMGMRLAGLEELTAPAAFGRWLEAGAYDVVMPDVKYVGGIAAVIEVGALAATHGAACAPHNPTGPVCHAASLAACAAMDGFLVLEHQVDETPLFFALAGDGLPRPLAGASDLPGGPGLGVELDLRPARAAFPLPA